MVRIENGNDNVYLNQNKGIENNSEVQQPSTPKTVEIVDSSKVDDNTDDYKASGAVPQESLVDNELSPRQLQQLNVIMHRKEQAEIEQLVVEANNQLKSSNRLEQAEAADTIKDIAQIEGGRLNSDRLSESQQNIAGLVGYNLVSGNDEFYNESYAELNNNDKKNLDKALKYLQQIPEEYREEISEDLINYAIKNASGDYVKGYSDSNVRSLVQEQVLRDITEYNPKLRIALKDNMPSEAHVRAGNQAYKGSLAKDNAEALIPGIKLPE